MTKDLQQRIEDVECKDSQRLLEPNAHFTNPVNEQPYLVVRNQVKWAKREDKSINPLDFFKENYSSRTTRSQLARKDSALYKILRRKNLMDEAIPHFNQAASQRGKFLGGVEKAEARDFGDDPVEYYTKHYNGLTRGQLAKEDPNLYQRLRRDELLADVPTANRFIDDPVAYYTEHYDGSTRGELAKEDRSLYQRLRRDGLLEHVPLEQR